MKKNTEILAERAEESRHEGQQKQLYISPGENRTGEKKSVEQSPQISSSTLGAFLGVLVGIPLGGLIAVSITGGQVIGSSGLFTLLLAMASFITATIGYLIGYQIDSE